LGKLIKGQNMKRRALDKNKGYMIVINTCLFAIGSVLVFIHWFQGLASKQQDFITAIKELTLNDTILLSTVAIMIGGLFYSIIILRPETAKRQREKELLKLTMEATEHNDYVDIATGFYNNLYFEKTLNTYLKEFSETEEKLGLFFVEAVSIGEIETDTLKQIGTTLINTARDYDIIARIGLTKFAVITPHIKKDDLTPISKRFHSKLIENVENSSGYRFPIGSASNEADQNSRETLQNATNANLQVNRRLLLEN